MTDRCQKLFGGMLALSALASSLHGQNPGVAKPKPQKPPEVPIAVVVLEIDTTAGDSTRTIITRDLDYGDRVQPLLLDSATLDEIWRPARKDINFTALAQTRANFIVRARPTLSGLHVQVYDVPKARLRQEGDFRLPKVPPYRLPVVRDSLLSALGKRSQAAVSPLTSDSLVKDSLAKAATKVVPLKTTRDRANAKRGQAVRDSLLLVIDRRGTLLRANAVRDTLRTDSAYVRLALKDSAVRDSLVRERRLGIHVVSDEVERWITGVRGIAATRIAFIDGTKLKIVDSDGANVRMIPTVGAALSPSWHPSGRYLVYVDAADEGTRIAQVDLRTMKARLLSASHRGLNITPVYTKDGKNIVWAQGGDSPAELMLASAAGEDTVPKAFVGRTGFETTSPSFSPDGKQVVFMSPRPLTPQLYTMNVDGTGLRLLTPVVAGKRSYRTGADWSPAGDEIAYQQQNGDFQVWTIRVKDRVMTQLTSEGENEDPAWAPDGRHLSLTRRLGAIGDPRGIWVIDERTGRLRQVTTTGDARLSDWSPPLRPVY